MASEDFKDSSLWSQRTVRQDIHITFVSYDSLPVHPRNDVFIYIALGHETTDKEHRF